MSLDKKDLVNTGKSPAMWVNFIYYKIRKLQTENGFMEQNVYVPQMLMVVKILCKVVFMRFKIITHLGQTENNLFFNAQR